MERTDDKPMDINELHAKVHALNAERFKRERDEAREDLDVLREAMGVVVHGRWTDPEWLRAFAAQALAALSTTAEPSPDEWVSDCCRSSKMTTRGGDGSPGSPCWTVCQECGKDCEAVAAPSPREEAVEVAAKALWDEDERRWANGSPEHRRGDPTPWDRAHELDRAEYRERVLPVLAALSAARPPSPTPEETREHAMQAAIDKAHGAMRASEYVGGPTEREAWRTALEALWPFVTNAKGMATPGDAATTKEGR